MSYDTVLNQIKSLPEKYLDELSAMIQSLIYRYEQEMMQSTGNQGLGEYFGVLDLGDGLSIQREVRNEWN